MNYAEWIESLQIFAKYDTEGLDDFPLVRARRQELCFGCPKELLSPEDKSRLEDLGWNDYESYGLMHHFM